MLTLQGRKVGINHLTFSPDGARLAAACYRGLVQVWDVSAAKLTQLIVVDPYRLNEGVFFLPDGAGLLAHDGWRLCAFGPDGRSLGLRPKGVRAEVRRAAEAGRGLVVAHASGVVLYGLPDFKPLWRVNALTNATALASTADGRVVALGQYAGHVRVFRDREEQTPPLRARLEVKAVALSPAGDAVAACAHSHLRLWRLTPEAREVAHVQLGKTHFLSVAWHPSGSFFATANGDGKIDYWDAATGQRRESFDWGLGKLHDVTFDATGDRAACASSNGDVVVWDVDR